MNDLKPDEFKTPIFNALYEVFSRFEERIKDLEKQVKALEQRQED